MGSSWTISNNMQRGFNIPITAQAQGIMSRIPFDNFTSSEDVVMIELPYKDFRSLNSLPIPYQLPDVILLIAMIIKKLVGIFYGEFSLWALFLVEGVLSISFHRRHKGTYVLNNLVWQKIV
ncbi:hypothetical protein PIB30_049059 [Stylosanthes scabra]|uniref:Uncharacterized protein n=1 Tax=Stylosanthes scabra TaxID=79078 RepID=A0ABU6WFH1_9FABA|nr:hypothetical protein [Stylosanthes scabra]